MTIIRSPLHPSVTVGEFCIIDEGVQIGENTVIGNYCHLKRGTIIGKNCVIDNNVQSSGYNIVGDNVTLRYGVILARGCQIGDGCYLAPRVMFNNLDTERIAIGGAKVGKNVFIGTHTVVNHGITICDNAVIGSMSLVLKDIVEPGKYMGIPCASR